MRIVVSLAFLCLPLCGCSGHWMKTAQSDCAVMGYSAGTPQYAECVERTYDRKRESFRRTVAVMGAAAGGASDSMREQTREMNQPSPTPAYHPVGARFFRYSYVSGMNRICVYDRLGSQEVETIDAAAICPLN